jgi:ABC-type molybdate transport system substrate-binding protein
MVVVLAVVLIAAVAGGALAYSRRGGKSKTSNISKANALKIDVAQELKGAVTKLLKDFEAQNKGIKVTTNFVSATALAAAVKKDKPDLAIGTRPQIVALAKSVKLQGKPAVLGSDQLTIVVAKGNPKKVKADLTVFGTHTSITSGTCKPKGRCLAFTTTASKAAKVDLHPDRTDAPAALVNAVADNKLDAALVLRTQAMQRAGKTTRIALPLKTNAAIQFAIGRVHAGGSVSKFMAFLATPKATQALTAFGLRG